MLLGIVKFVPVPTLAAWQILAKTTIPGAGTITAFVALALIFAGVFMYGVLKNRADEAERVKNLAQSEAEIERRRADRERDDRVAAEAEMERLRALPNLEKHERLLAGSIQLMDKLIAASNRHEEQATARFHMLEGHIEELAGAIDKIGDER